MSSTQNTIFVEYTLVKIGYYYVALNVYKIKVSDIIKWKLVKLSTFVKKKNSS